MDWKIFFATFGALFVAELGDKTQLACILMTAKTQKPVSVFLGASLALITVTLLAVILAHILTQYLPENIIKKAAAVGFVFVGMLMFFDKL